MKKLLYLLVLQIAGLAVMAQVKSTDDALKDLSAGMVAVQGGTYTMGCTPEQGTDCYDKPHSVTVKNFSISRYLVTQAQWKAVMGITYSNYFMGCDNCPIETVSWNDAQEFIARLNSLTGQKYRLPTEAEWEYAARGGNANRGYVSADNSGIDGMAWYSGNSANQTHPVGQKQANELGLFDMAGNVWEWCSDRYGVYVDSSSNYNFTGADETRVLRGGSWRNEAGFCRVAYRNADAPDDRFTFGGFRLARD